MTTLPPQSAYNLLAATYDDAPNPLLALERRTLEPLLPDVRGSRVIDAAAGTGYWASRLIQRGARAISVDFCQAMLTLAPPPAVRADITHLPFPAECADLTVCAFGLGYAPGALTELMRVTRPGGVIFASDVHPDAIRAGWTRSFRYDKEEIAVEHHRYSLHDLQLPGLTLTALEEPRLGEPERELFAAAGRLHRFDEAARHPAIFVARWTRL
jgi:ubiquinone/menaquinone biosynthesis C-methylase UbiE